MRLTSILVLILVVPCLTGAAIAGGYGESELRGRRAWAGSESPALASQEPVWLQILARQDAVASAERSRASSDIESSPPEGDAVQGRWSDFLPLWGKRLRDEGYDIPLPFGVGLIGMGLWQDIEQSNLKLSFDEGAPPVPIDIVHLSPADAVDGAIGVRVDAFILPFFNIYTMGGFNAGEVEFDITIDPNIVLPEGAEFSVEEDYKAGFVGLGGTIALGWKQLFWMADGNGSWAWTDSTNGTIVAATFSTRAGWRGEFKGMALSGWVGTMYMNYAQTVSTSVPELGLEVELDIKGADPWNMLAGAQIELSPNWQLMIEGGFIGRKQVTGVVTFRF